MVCCIHCVHTLSFNQISLQLRLHKLFSAKYGRIVYNGNDVNGSHPDSYSANATNMVENGTACVQQNDDVINTPLCFTYGSVTTPSDGYTQTDADIASDDYFHGPFQRWILYDYDADDGKRIKRRYKRIHMLRYLHSVFGSVLAILENVKFLERVQSPCYQIFNVFSRCFVRIDMHNDQAILLQSGRFYIFHQLSVRIL